MAAVAALGVALVEAQALELPPAPPGFPGTTILQSPKGAEQQVRALQVAAPHASTNHQAPVVVIKFAIEPYGVVERDQALTNQVPAKISQDVGPSMRIEYVTAADKTYEVQYAHWINGPWMTFIRFTAPRPDITTSWYLIDRSELSKFFRVMCN